MSSPEHHATESSLDGPQRVMLAGLRTRMFGRESTERIGRYRLLHALGTGAHGEVFEAVDEALQRRVAVKVLRGSKRRHTDAVLARRLRREAQALARLHHPNVVEVFGAGVHGGQVYIAMELVSGSTLRGWALDHPVGDRATAKATLGILRQAGRGLAAAHEAGVLHRDFKPGNVLVGDDGRVRVADFGLARWAAGDVAESQPAHPTVPTDGSLTATGGLLGTPRYMSPEQLAGGVVDERSDQYNFAVAAWELLTGELPGPRASLASRSEVEPAPALPKHRWLPRSVYRALIRALQPAPRDRHATMGALLDGLRSTSAPGPVLGMGAVGVLAVGAAWSTAGDDGRPRCDRGVAADEVAQVWSATRRREVEAGLRSTGAPFAATTVATVAATVDAYAEAWVEQRVALCRGTWHEGTVSPRQLDAGMGCLRQGLRTVDSLLARLDSADAALIERAQEAVVGIAPPSHCTAPDATGGGPPASPALRRELADAEAAALAGDDESAEALAERVAARALEQGQTRAYGDALEVSGALGARRREARGYEQLQRAYETAAGLGEDHKAFRRARRLAMTAATLTRFDEADTYLRHAQAALARGTESADDAAQLAVARCWVVHKRAGSNAALPACEAAAEHAEAAGVSPTTRRDATRFLATVHGTLGRVEEAEQRLLTLHDETVAAFGAEHPEAAEVLKSLAYMAARRDDAPTAIARMTEAASLLRAARGTSDESLPTMYADLGSFHSYARNFEEGQAALDEALVALDQQPDRDPTKRRLERMRVQGTYAVLLRTRGQPDDAIAMLRRALSETEWAMPEDHWLTLSTRLALGATLLFTHDYAGADEQLAVVVTGLRRAKHPRLAEALLHHGLALEGLARWDEAVAVHEAVVGATGSTEPQAAASRAHLGWIAARRGRREEAEDHLTKLEEAGEGGSYADAVAGLARAELAWLRADDRGADDAMDASISALEDPYPGAAQADTLWRARARRRCRTEPLASGCSSADRNPPAGFAVDSESVR